MTEKKELVVKSNKLVEASYRLTLVEQRIVLYAIVCARETGKGLNSSDFVSISAKDYAAHYNVDEDNAYLQIKEAAFLMYERGFVLYDTDPESGNPRTVKARWVSAATYVDRSGKIQLRFSPEIVPYITRLEKEFTRYKLEMVANMTSSYAIRMYELLIQWGSVGTRDIEVSWLRNALLLDDQYPLLTQFKRWVVDMAVNQINKHSDLQVSYAQRKNGRTVTHFLFTFCIKDGHEQKADCGEAGAKAGGNGRATVQQTPIEGRATKGTGKGTASMEEMVVDFLRNNERYLNRHSNVSPHIAWRTPAIWVEFKGEFEEWLRCCHAAHKK